jgi:hypothetical protein
MEAELMLPWLTVGCWFFNILLSETVAEQRRHRLSAGVQNTSQNISGHLLDIGVHFTQCKKG